MRRPLASVLAAALAALPALARAEPLDLDLAGLGAPSPEVQAALSGGRPTPTAADVQAAADARRRFALLSSEVALAFSAPLLQPASTTGHSGFDVGLEGALVPVHPRVIGGVDAWPTRGVDPHELTLTSLHVRKALPFSFELGGRVLYLSRSSYVGAQLEARWALEGFDRLPALALRAAWTEVLGQKDWNLGTGELDLIVSRRWGLGAVTSLTPYLAARLGWLNASSDPISFRPAASSDPAAAASTQAAFPRLRDGTYRTTAGVRVTAHLVSLAAEATYFGGSSLGRSSPGEDGYPRLRVPASFGGALRLGLEL